jgi:hypothetical protein
VKFNDPRLSQTVRFDYRAAYFSDVLKYRNATRKIVLAATDHIAYASDYSDAQASLVVPRDFLNRQGMTV